MCFEIKPWPYWPSWGILAEQTVQNALPLRSLQFGILGLFREADSSKRPSSSKLPTGHFGAFSQSKQFKTPFLFEVLYWASWGLFAKQTIQNALPLGSSLLGILGPFRRANSSKRPSSSKFSIGHVGAFSQSTPFKTPFLFEDPYWESWGLFAEQTVQNALPLRSSLLGILGPFRKANNSERPSSWKFPTGHFGAFSQNKQFKTSFLFEVLYWASWGLFAEHTVQNAVPLRRSLLGVLGPFRRTDSSKRPSSSKFSIGHLGAFSQSTPFKTPFLFEDPYWESWGLFAEQTVQNVLPLRSSLLGILGPFRRAHRSKRRSSSKIPIGSLGAFSQNRQFKTSFLFEVLYWASWGLFAKQTIQNALPLGSSLLGILGPFRRTDSSKRPSSSKFSIGHLGAFSQSTPFKTPFLFEDPYWESWGLFAEQTVQNVLPLRSSLLGILGPFRRAHRSKRRSSSKIPIGSLGAFSQNRQFKTSFLFEVLYWASWGLFAEHTVQNAVPLRRSLLGVLGPFRRTDSSKRPSSSKFSIGHLGAFSQSTPFKTPFLFEDPYWESWGLFAEQTVQNVLPLRSSLLGILGPFRRAHSSKRRSSSKIPIGSLGAFSQNRQFKTSFLFEVLYWASWGLFAEHTVQNAVPLRRSLLGVLGPFRRTDSSKRPSSSKFSIGHLGAFSQSTPFKTPFLFEDPYWESWGLFAEQTVQNVLPLRSSLLGILGLSRKADRFKTPFLFEVPYWVFWGLLRKAGNSKRRSSSKFPLGHLGAFSQGRQMQNALPLGSSLLGILGSFRKTDSSKRRSSSNPAGPVSSFWPLSK